MNTDRLFEIHREFEDSLKVSVKIGHEEVLKIVLRDLIAKRNSCNIGVRESFDAVLRFYLVEEEFQKYVVRKEKIE